MTAHFICGICGYEVELEEVDGAVMEHAWTDLFDTHVNSHTPEQVMYYITCANAPSPDDDGDYDAYEVDGEPEDGDTGD